MKTLSIQEQKTLEKLFKLDQPTLLKVMKQYLKKKYDEVIETEDYLIAVGDIPIALVAHLDTVFKSPPENIYYDRVKNVMWSPDGLGADDRAGVYSIVQIVQKVDSKLKPTVIFTTDEELGDLGAQQLVLDYPNVITELKYIIELDRRGTNDCVFYQCANSKFEEYVENFGFVTNFGSFSDISVICPAWGVAGVNLSIGYQNEHSESEILHVGQMYNTIKRVLKMLEVAETAPSFEYIELYGSRTLSYYSYPKEDEFFFDWDPAFGISKEDWNKYMLPQSKCHKCGEYDFEYNLVPVGQSDGSKKYYCVDCLNKENSHIYWCESCGEPYFDNKNSKINKCYVCRGVKENGNK